MADPKGIDMAQKTRIGKFKDLSYLPIEQVRDFLVAAEGDTFEGFIDRVFGANYLALPRTFQGNYEISFKKSEAGKIYRTELRFDAPANFSEAALTDGRKFVLFATLNGVRYIIGTPDYPAIVEASTTGNGTDKSATKYRFIVESARPILKA